MEKEGFVAVRANDLGPWIDSSSFRLLAECVEESIKQAEKDIPWWSKANPVVAVVHAKIVIDDKELYQ